MRFTRACACVHRHTGEGYHFWVRGGDGGAFGCGGVVVVRLRRWYVGRVEWVNTVGKVKCVRRIVRSTRVRLEVQN